SIVSDIDLLLTDKFFSTAQIAVDIYDLSGKEIVFRKNNKQLLHPASNMKILTSAAGLYFLGPDYEFTTGIWYTGELDDSVLVGDLYYAGGFDPDFTIKDMDSLSGEIAGLGIKNITGSIIGDISLMDSLFWGSGWMWDDDPTTNFPYMTPLVINDAAVMIEYMPGEEGAPAIIKTTPESDYFEIENNSVTISDTTQKFKITREWIDRSDRIIIERNIDTSATLDTIRLNLVNSTEYFLTMAKESLIRNGVEVIGGIKVSVLPEDSQKLVTHSRAYREVIVNLNKESDNLSAEMTLRALSKNKSNKPASADGGMELIDSLISIAGLNPQTYRLVDGSGVSHYNLVTAELLTDLLKYFYFDKPELYTILKNSFPISGIDGTLKTRMENSEAYSRVYAKTGTLSGVSCLSGYINSESGTEYVFSIMLQNFVGSADEARNIQDRICNILSQH
ncbi:MAG: D-alanyl-D-alanine carboxypeptidase/D-alanyl-D-alanine-endopeptidase, partial [Thermodesulfovibrionia bacterium]|nr:D-alanyl-D-alanine carboxypeptidase/D-alanyl-D-alanine-endopeptidase [Thermodesulfovibrionia bacterium]